MVLLLSVILAGAVAAVNVHFGLVWRLWTGWRTCRPREKERKKERGEKGKWG